MEEADGGISKDHVLVDHILHQVVDIEVGLAVPHRECVFPVKVFMKRQYLGDIHRYFAEIGFFLDIISYAALSFDAHVDGRVLGAAQ